MKNLIAATKFSEIRHRKTSENFIASFTTFRRVSADPEGTERVAQSKPLLDPAIQLTQTERNLFMSTLLTVHVRNMEPQTQGFYFFQEPSVYTGGGEVYSNSLFSASLANYDEAGSVLTFQVNMQFYAGIQEANEVPAVGQSSGFSSASRAIDLQPASGSADDWTEATVSPLGLSATKPGQGVQEGAFRISTPVFSSPPFYNVGSAVDVNGGIVLSNFVQANPNSNTDCQPILKYYVQTGQFTPGSVMNFTQSSIDAATCDFTGGYSVINVDLERNGTWTVKNVQ